jgi:nitric oxide reductase subunit C
MFGTKWFFAIGVFLGLLGVGSLVANTFVANSATQLPPQVAQGQQVWVANQCESCHGLVGQGGQYAPDLTHIVGLRGETYLREFFVNPGAFHPNQRVMPRLNITRDEVTHLIAYLQYAQDAPLAQNMPIVQVVGGGGVVSSVVTVSDNMSAEDMALADGRAIFSARCASCHSLEKDVVIIGPSFWDIGNRAWYRVTGQSAEQYIRNSIVYPTDFVVEGYQDVMQKNLGEVLSSDDIENVVTFLVSLKDPNSTASQGGS